jgi:erythronate-4-phosphate dehydrogenase
MHLNASNKIKIVADDKIPFLKGVLEPYTDIQYFPGREISAAHVKDADALIIRTRTKCNKELLEDSKVRFIATATIGYDHIDTDYCTARNISWQNAPGCNSSSVEQYLLSALLILSGRKNFMLADKTIGIIGVGHVGSKVEKIARHMGMNVIKNDPPRERIEHGSHFVSLNQILKESDIITLHVPLIMAGQDKTFHMADRHFFNLLGKKAHLINTSRGEVIEEKILKNAIKSGKLESVVLDVWENEPFIDKELSEMVDIATPHIAGYSLDGKANGTAISIRSLSRLFRLDLDNWMPQDIPAPLNNKFSIDANGKKMQEIISETILKTYNVLEDDTRFRKSILSFEKQREQYPLRREYGAYTLRILNDHVGSKSVLREMGFNILETYKDF